MDYYDLVLGSIPVALFGVTGALTLFGVGVTSAVSLGSLAATGLIGHAMFVRAPELERDGGNERTSPATPPRSSYPSAD